MSTFGMAVLLSSLVSTDVNIWFRDAQINLEPSYKCNGDSNMVGVFINRNQIDSEPLGATGPWRKSVGTDWTSSTDIARKGDGTYSQMRFFFNIDNPREKAAYQSFLSGLSMGKRFHLGYWPATSSGSFCNYYGYRVNYISLD